MAFLNFKPFELRTDSFLRNLQLGGSIDAGIENNPLSPAVLTTSAPPSPSTLTPGSAFVPFLAFNNGVMERGYRALWELHAAYYYQGLSLLGAWDSGFQDYAFGTSGPRPVRVPTGGYFVQAGYILTGETIRDRTLIDPLSPFDLRPGHFGLGALELIARFSDLSLGRQVFTGGLANPNLWTNHAQMVDVGLQLVSQQIRQGVLRLGACHLRQPRLLQHGGLPEVERPVLVAVPGLLLTRGAAPSGRGAHS